MAGSEPTIMCPSCSALVSSASGHCPQCGHWLPTELPSRPPTLEAQRDLAATGGSAPLRRAASTAPPHGPSPTRPGPSSILRTALPWFGVAAAIVLAAVWIAARSSPDAVEAPARLAEGVPAAPGAASSVHSGAQPSPADPLDLDASLARATSEALRWNRDAQLVEITLTDVVGGRIAPGSGGAIQIRFGAPPLGRRLGPGARVGTDQVLVRVDDRGQRTEQVRGPAARSVAPPTCGFDRAWRAAVASGVASDEPLTMRFALDKRGQRAVWTVQPDGSREPTRTLDGSSCAIILRR
jgi:hypothetical protein